MARIAREIIYQESNCFHVLVQGVAKSYIFDCDLYKSYYLKIISDKLKKYQLSLLAFCVMGNHAHFLVFPKDKNSISKFFQEVNVTYAQFYNRENKRVGYVFRDRFKAEPIIGEEYLINCISYIHQNPVKANIVELAEEYSFSSAMNYKTQTGLVDFDAVKNLLTCIPQIDKETDFNFVEDDYEGKIELADAIKNAMIKYSVEDVKTIDDETLSKLIKDIRQNTKVSLRNLAEFFEINRERIRTVMSVTTSP